MHEAKRLHIPQEINLPYPCIAELGALKELSVFHIMLASLHLKVVSVLKHGRNLNIHGAGQQLALKP
jgi:hypothetical protein